ncbi:MAG: 50S ribosomal protein L23 [Bdellovibrio sp.]|nr:MAG: 50S ribosomal protein L23 [Bdellovibrio sp.]
MELNILKKPLISEKNAVLNAAGVYVFEVEREATKPDIKGAVEKFFGVRVQSVRTVNCRGRAKANKYGRGRTPHWKKAMVKLAAGEKIALFEGA